jgi:cytosine/adenosine deaminase-related metal-dependent hydrolase
VAPSQAKDLLFRLQQGTFDEAYEALSNLQGLDKANLAADLCVRSGGETGYARELLEAYGEFTTRDVLETLAASRSISKFPTPDEQQVEKALAALKVSHAKAAVACITAADSPSKEMTGIVEVFLGSGQHAVEHLLDLIVREYDAWSEPHLAMIREKIEAATSSYRQGVGPLAVNEIVELLSEWDDISQPVQLLEEFKGHEEPRSKEIYRIVRDFCLWLANENDHYEEALIISRALLETFPELPALAAQLAQDVDVLESLA